RVADAGCRAENEKHDYEPGHSEQLAEAPTQQPANDERRNHLRCETEGDPERGSRRGFRARGLTPADLIELLPQLVEIAMFRVGHGAPVLRNKFCVATVLGSR